jgi:hypothetical protein
VSGESLALTVQRLGAKECRARIASGVIAESRFFISEKAKEALALFFETIVDVVVYWPV